MTIRLAEPPPPPIPAPAGWEGILAPGETILWQGRPDGALALTAAHLLQGVFGLAFAGFALIWMVIAATAGGYFWMFGLIHFTVGLGVMLAAPLSNMILRRASWYTLTTSGAVIASDLPVLGKRLTRYSIGADTPIRFEQGDPFSSLYFAERQRRGRNRMRVQPIGFERIAEGSKVMALIRRVQGGLT